MGLRFSPGWHCSACQLGLGGDASVARRLLETNQAESSFLAARTHLPKNVESRAAAFEKLYFATFRRKSAVAVLDAKSCIYSYLLRYAAIVWTLATRVQNSC